MFLHDRLHNRMDGTGYYLPDWRDSAWWQANGTGDRPQYLNKTLSSWGTTAVDLLVEADVFSLTQDNTHSGSAA